MAQADYGLLQPSVKLNTPFENLSTVLQLRNQQDAQRGLLEQRQALAEERRAQTDKLQREQAREAALMQLFTDNPSPKRADIMKVDPSENGSRIATAIDALQDTEFKRYTDHATVIKHAVAGVLAWPEPGRANAYAAVRNDFISRGWASPEQIPEQFDQEYVEGQQRLLLSPDKQYDLQHPKLAERNPTQDLYNPQTGAIVTPGTPKEEHSPALREYQDAQGQGYKGSFQQYQTEDANRKRPVTNINAGGQTPAGNWDKTGEDFLSTVPAAWRRTVQKIAHYDEDPTKVTSMRSGMRETVMQWVNQVNPAYDSSQFTNRAPTRKAYTTGTQGQQITAINTAIGHIDQLTGLAKELQNGGFTPGNRAFNSVRSMFGQDQVTNFNTLKDALAAEVDSVMTKGSATVSGREEARRAIHDANSPTQLAGYVKTLIPVMGSKLAALDYGYHQAMGAEDSFSSLSPETKRILTAHGFDPAHPTIGAHEKGADQDGAERAIPGVPGGIAKLQNGKWIRIK